MHHLLGRVRLPHVLIVVAVAFLLGSGTTYAAQQVTGQQISNNTVTTKDIMDGTLTGTDIKNGTLTGLDVKNDSLSSSDVKDESIKGKDVAPESLTSGDLGVSSVGASEIAAGAVRGDEVADGTLSPQDVGVLTAKVKADGTLVATSGGVAGGPPVTATKSSLAGDYSIDFHFTLVSCTFAASVGEPTFTNFEAYGNASVSVQGSSIVGVQTTDTRGEFADRPFHLIVVC